MSAEPVGPAAAGSARAGAWAWPSEEVLAGAGRLGGAVAAAVLAGTGTGSATLVAILLGIAVADRRTGTAAVLAVLASGIRWRTDGFEDLAGIQGVLGLAVEVGPAPAAASAWLAALAVLLAVGPLAGAAGEPRWRSVVPALPAGLLAAALVAGPGPESLLVRLLGAAAGVALALAVTLLDLRAERTDRRVRFTGARRLAGVAAGAGACVLAGWPA